MSIVHHNNTNLHSTRYQIGLEDTPPNDDILWGNYLNVPEVGASYNKACLWHSNFKTMLAVFINGRLSVKLEGKIGEREFRKFPEALNSVSGNSFVIER